VYLPTWLFLCCIAYLAELVYWLFFLKKHHEHVKTVHKLMAAVLVIKVLNLFFESVRSSCSCGLTWF
jgi:hypothetical protein